MPNSQGVSPVYCPSCGASITMDGAKGSCTYCGTVVERPAQAAPPQPPVMQQVSWTMQSLPTNVGQPVVIRRRSSCSGVIFTLVLIVVIGVFIGQTASRGRLIAQFLNLARGNGTIATAISQVSATAVSRISLSPITTIAAVLPRDGAGGDLLVYTYGVDDGRYKLALIDGRSRATRWQSASLSKNAYQGRLVAGRDLVYLTDQSDLLALSLRDGKPAWQASLVVEPPSGCDECLRLIGNRVIVLQKDGSLQAFDAQSGERRWQVALAAHEANRLRGLGDWDWHMTPKGLAVVQVLRDQTQLSVQTIAPRTGVISGQKVTDLTGSHMPTLQSVAWADDMAWLKIDNTMYAIDLATGAPTQ